MHSTHDFLKQALWLSVCIVPVPAGAFAVQTADALIWGLLIFTALSTLVPFFYFSMKKSGYNAEWGKRRCAVHLECALSVCGVLWLSLWALAAGGVSFSTGLGPVWSAFIGMVGLLLVTFLIFLMDYGVLALYRRLSCRGEAVTQWLTLSFLIGWIPGTLLTAYFLFALANVGSTVLFVIFMSGGMTWILFLKIVLGIMSIVFYLYFSLEEPRMRRIIQIIFTAFLWFFLLYVPLVISVQLPGFESWRTWADPAYLSVIPFVSELWSVGLACFAGRKITEWIYAAAE